MTDLDRDRIRSAWQGRVSGCVLGKPVEILSMREGREALSDYLERADAVPLRDYVPALEDTLPGTFGRGSCRGQFDCSEPDDDINYTVIALMLLERHGANLTTADVARAWLRLLPAAAVHTAEREAYRVLLDEMNTGFPFGADPGFDLDRCSDNRFNDWIGAQIRADLYGWVCPGRPALAADLARRDARLSHRGDGVHGAAFVAALGATIPAAPSLEAAIEVANQEVPSDSLASKAIAFGLSLVDAPDPVDRLHDEYGELSPVHTVNNLALVVWGLLAGSDDFGVAVGDTVAAGWDTDCNGATVGGLWGLTGRPIPPAWTEPWQGRVGVSLAGFAEIPLEELVDRTVAVGNALEG